MIIKITTTRAVSSICLYIPVVGSARAGSHVLLKVNVVSIFRSSTLGSVIKEYFFTQRRTHFCYANGGIQMLISALSYEIRYISGIGRE